MMLRRLLILAAASSAMSAFAAEPASQPAAQPVSKAGGRIPGGSFGVCKKMFWPSHSPSPIGIKHGAGGRRLPWAWVREPWPRGILAHPTERYGYCK